MEPIAEPAEPDPTAEAVVAPPAVSPIASDLAYSLNNSKDRDALQHLGYMIQQMTSLSQSDKEYLRTIYHNKFKSLTK
jgi:hypothetical protein